MGAMTNTGAGEPPLAALAIYDDLLDEDRVRAAYQSLSRWPRIPHGLFWCELSRIQRYHAGDRSQADCLGEHFGELTPFLFDLFARVLAVVPPSAQTPTGSLEFWTGCNGASSEQVYLHVDSHSMDGGRPGAEPHPLLGTIFHLGPAEGVQGGSTFFCTERPVPPTITTRNRTSLPEREALALSTQWVEVPRRFNRLVRFEGSLPHFRGAITAASGPRVALFANLWPTTPQVGRRPRECALISPAEFRAYLRMPPGEARAMRALASRFTSAEIASLAGVFHRLYGGPAAAG
jgi:hypothetical protein